ncbi:MAG: flagellar hook-associated protein FlgL [bacterium]
MRITTKMMAKSMLATIQRNQQAAAEKQLDIATTKKVRRPSDDPGGILQIQEFKVLISRNEQYLKNVNQYRGFVTGTTAALDAITDDLQEAKNIAIQGGSDTVNAEARQSLARHVDQLLDNIVDHGNARFKGRYLFGGTLTTGTKPFTRSGDVITYNGNTADIQGNIGFDTKITYNKTGQSVFAPPGGVDIFSELVALKQGLESNDTTAIQNAVDQLGGAIDQTISLSAELGVVQERLTLTEQTIESDNINLADFLSRIEDTDVVEEIVNLQTLQNATSTALRTLADVLQTSLVDFVR